MTISRSHYEHFSIIFLPGIVHEKQEQVVRVLLDRDICALRGNSGVEAEVGN